MNRAMPASILDEAPRRELQQMWRSLLRGEWSSIVVVPTDGSIPAREVVGALVAAAALYDLEHVHIIDAVGVSPAVGERLAKEMLAIVASGARAVAAVDSIMQSLSGIPLVRDAEAALLVVRLGQSTFEYVQSTIDLVRRERILGAVTLPR